MQPVLLPFLSALLIGQTAGAQTSPSSLSGDQKGYIAYNRCLVETAVHISYTNAPDADIYRQARVACTEVRSAAVAGQQDNKTYMAALDASDLEKAQNFPSWIKGVRERRRAREAETQNAKP